jgi:hypothetical protein
LPHNGKTVFEKWLSSLYQLGQSPTSQSLTPTHLVIESRESLLNSCQRLLQVLDRPYAVRIEQPIISRDGGGREEKAFFR